MADPVALQLFVAFISAMWKQFCTCLSLYHIGVMGSFVFVCLNMVTSFFLQSDIFQTCFVDCLIEQTHPEIRKRYDQDVSELSAYSCLWIVCGEKVVL